VNVAVTSPPRGWPYWIAWGGLTAILLLLFPSTRYFIPFWQLPAEEMQGFEIMCVGFVASTLLAWYSTRARAGAAPSTLLVLLWTMSIFGLVFMALTLLNLTGWRRIHAEMLILALVLLPATFVYRTRPLLILGGLLLAGAAAAAVSLFLAFGPQPGIPVQTQTSVINTEYYNIEARFYEGRVPRPAVPGGGGLARLGGDQYLLVTGDGHFYVFAWKVPGDDLSVRALPYQVPLNGEEFSAAVGLPYEKPRETILTATGAVGESTGSLVDTWRFRVSDLLLQDLPDGRLRLFAGHHYWNNAQRCFSVRVSVAEADRAGFISGAAKLDWKTLYESKPCLPIEGELRERTAPFEGNLSGGRLALRDPNSLLFTVGFHGFDGVNAKQLYSQDPQASWGTLVLIHLDTGASEIFANGLRNQQGLYVDPSGGIWETEHGPRGGDELNFIEQGVNYGWPLVTYGTDYNSLTWPLNKSQGRHDGFRQPMFAWTPSIGVSQLIGIRTDLFPIWKGDLLISSLRAESLFRARLVDQRVVLVEPIEIKRRVRTLLEGYDGRIVLWTEDAALGMIRPASGTSAALAFATTCGGCHHVDGGTALIGPDLEHVYGRRIAGLGSFGEYSPALARLGSQGGRWNRDTLDRFLTNPQAMVPGTAMPLQGIADPAQRAAIIDFLEQVKDRQP
jgi:aldose sugar dehydrogenase